MSTTSPRLSTAFTVPFTQGDLSVLLSKTSVAKKTIAALINFFTERAHIQAKYSTRLLALSKADGLLKRNLKTYKGLEQTTLRAVCDSLMDTASQEAELHRKLSEGLTAMAVKPLTQLLQTLRTHKKSWMERAATNIKEVKQAENEVEKERSRSETAQREIEKLASRADRKSQDRLQDLVPPT